ncbi:MAG TPA: large conductance mechanosensitive channel protein MscL [Alphaproteobacteria bacterium]|nr:large conductance mechanosensitive channel protein MscL [Alphaproteobacteria bacterium]
MKGFIHEFREFAMRGNVLDMAVGIVIGAAFTAIVNSLVKDVIMPPIGLVSGGLDFSNLFLTLSDHHYATLAEATAAGAPVLRYGVFINTIINFLIVAFAIFILVKQVNRFKRKEEAAPAEPPVLPPDVVLLTEIRDLLKAR